MTTNLYNHLELCQLIYQGNTTQAMQLYQQKLTKFSPEGHLMQKCFLSSINYAIYNFILHHENVSLHDCCHQNETFIHSMGYSQMKEIGEQIIHSYASCVDYRIEKHKNEYIRQAVSYIHAHLAEELTLDIVCKEINVNKCYFCKLFKQEVKQNFSQYILGERIHLAKQLLLKSDYSIQVIAEKCGFSNSSYFCTCFKKTTGTSPSKFVQQNFLSNK